MSMNKASKSSSLSHSKRDKSFDKKSREDVFISDSIDNLSEIDKNNCKNIKYNIINNKKKSSSVMALTNKQKMKSKSSNNINSDSNNKCEINFNNNKDGDIVVEDNASPFKKHSLIPKLTKSFSPLSQFSSPAPIRPSEKSHSKFINDETAIEISKKSTLFLGAHKASFRSSVINSKAETDETITDKSSSNRINKNDNSKSIDNKKNIFHENKDDKDVIVNSKILPTVNKQQEEKNLSISSIDDSSLLGIYTSKAPSAYNVGISCIAISSNYNKNISNTSIDNNSSVLSKLAISREDGSISLYIVCVKSNKAKIASSVIGPIRTLGGVVTNNKNNNNRSRIKLSSDTINDGVNDSNEDDYEEDMDDTLFLHHHTITSLHFALSDTVLVATLLSGQIVVLNSDDLLPLYIYQRTGGAIWDSAVLPQWVGSDNHNCTKHNSLQVKMPGQQEPLHQMGQRQYFYCAISDGSFHLLEIKKILIAGNNNNSTKKNIANGNNGASNSINNLSVNGPVNSASIDLLRIQPKITGSNRALCVHACVRSSSNRGYSVLMVGGDDLGNLIGWPFFDPNDTHSNSGDHNIGNDNKSQRHWIITLPKGGYAKGIAYDDATNTAVVGTSIGDVVCIAIADSNDNNIDSSDIKVSISAVFQLHKGPITAVLCVREIGNNNINRDNNIDNTFENSCFYATGMHDSMRCFRYLPENNRNDNTYNNDYNKGYWQPCEVKRHTHYHEASAIGYISVSNENIESNNNGIILSAGRDGTIMMTTVLNKSLSNKRMILMGSKRDRMNVEEKEDTEIDNEDKIKEIVDGNQKNSNSSLKLRRFSISFSNTFYIDTTPQRYAMFYYHNNKNMVLLLFTIANRGLEVYQMKQTLTNKDDVTNISNNNTNANHNWAPLTILEACGRYTLQNVWVSNGCINNNTDNIRSIIIATQTAVKLSIIALKGALNNSNNNNKISMEKVLDLNIVGVSSVIFSEHVNNNNNIINNVDVYILHHEGVTHIALTEKLNDNKNNNNNYNNNIMNNNNTVITKINMGTIPIIIPNNSINNNVYSCFDNMVIATKKCSSYSSYNKNKKKMLNNSNNSISNEKDSNSIINNNFWNVVENGRKVLLISSSLLSLHSVLFKNNINNNPNFKNIKNDTNNSNYYPGVVLSIPINSDGSLDLTAAYGSDTKNLNYNNSIHEDNNAINNKNNDNINSFTNKKNTATNSPYYWLSVPGMKADVIHRCGVAYYKGSFYDISGCFEFDNNRSNNKKNNNANSSCGNVSVPLPRFIPKDTRFIAKFDLIDANNKKDNCKFNSSHNKALFLGIYSKGLLFSTHDRWWKHNNINNNGNNNRITHSYNNININYSNKSTEVALSGGPCATYIDGFSLSMPVNDNNGKSHKSNCYNSLLLLQRDIESEVMSLPLMWHVRRFGN